MSLTGKAFKFLNRSKEPKEIWDALEEEFAPTEEEDRYELEEEFKQCKMTDQYDNPTDWFNQLDEINTRIGSIEGGKYIKTEDDIKLQIRMNLPETVYSEVITSFKNYSTMTLKEVKKEIKQFYRRMKRTDKLKETKTENIMLTKKTSHYKPQGKPRFTNSLKGKPYNRGEYGQKSSDWSKPKKVSQGKKVPKHIKCFLCGDNHYVSNCPMRKEIVEQTNVFVGMTEVIKKENELKEQIKLLTALEKITLVNRILSKVGSKNLLFEPENDKFVNSEVINEVNKLLNDWTIQDNDVLKNEYKEFVKENKNKKEKENKKKIKKNDPVGKSKNHSNNLKCQM